MALPDLSILLVEAGCTSTDGYNAGCDDCGFVYQIADSNTAELFSIMAVNHSNDHPLCAVAACHLSISDHLNGEHERIKKCIFEAAKEMTLFNLKKNQYRFENRRYNTLRASIPHAEAEVLGK